ncbi:DUF4202 domain-containing protein [Cellvibrio japonicus]|uniref:Glutamyl-tRNA synthetase n=1 Tax=Cellvibrio japonicus (strain Ueda107) TaxID=498211 RepID=B3PJ85_CELJU|nr:DUF4202 domain-containing protein [Cellvibrio japonicus]ACE86036.1 hypothetical protein CJA_2197 [Cellvibrio japonicus Ueda107]QEI12639.1 DUF4202 domain-containing protein [Cellvibrio japonicus]QEI16213.1 DUF4202 domain-containing protein [Cellvibrio japonicus]QEI19791.1 DUF4202 domain-containing protein [Cellvibrio japonicus]
MTNTERLIRTLSAFDSANAQDPHHEPVDGKLVPKEWIYGQRMSEHLYQLCATPSEALQLAVRSQHICRWKIPRSDYPMDKAGYKKWRTDLAKLHGEIAGDIMANEGYDTITIERVKDLLLKRGLKRDEEVQTLEDVACLVFIQYYLEDFASKHSEEKLIDIIRKTWNKMSARGHEAALKLPLPEALQTLVGKALAA